MMATGWETSGSAEDGWGWGVPQQAQQAKAKPSVEWPKQEKQRPEEWWLNFRCDSNRMMRVAQGIWEPHGPPASRRLLELCAVALFRLELLFLLVLLGSAACHPPADWCVFLSAQEHLRRCLWGRGEKRL